MKSFDDIVGECWKTHKKEGMKMKGGKMVPNCVPKHEAAQIDEMDVQMKDDIENGRAIDPASQVQLDQDTIDADIENIPKDQEMKDVQIQQQKVAARNGEAPPKMNGRQDPRKSSASQNGNGNK